MKNRENLQYTNVLAKSLKTLFLSLISTHNTESMTGNSHKIPNLELNSVIQHDMKKYQEEDGTLMELFVASLLRMAIYGAETYENEIKRINNQKENTLHLPNQLNTQHVCQFLKKIRRPLISLITNEKENLLAFNFTISNYALKRNKIGIHMVPSYDEIANKNEFADLLLYTRFALSNQILNSLIKSDRIALEKVINIFTNTTEILELFVKEISELNNKNLSIMQKVLTSSTDNQILISQGKNNLQPLLQKMQKISKELKNENPFSILFAKSKNPLTENESKVISLIVNSLITFDQLIVSDLVIFFFLFTSNILNNKDGNPDHEITGQFMTSSYDSLVTFRKSIRASIKAIEKNTYTKNIFSDKYIISNKELKDKYLKFLDKNESYYANIKSTIMDSNGLFPVFVNFGENIQMIILSSAMIRYMVQNCKFNTDQNLQILFDCAPFDKHKDIEKNFISKIFGDVLFATAFSQEDETFHTKDNKPTPELLKMIQGYLSKDLGEEMNKLSQNKITDMYLDKDHVSKIVTLQSGNKSFEIPNKESFHKKYSSKEESNLVEGINHFFSVPEYK